MYFSCQHFNFFFFNFLFQVDYLNSVLLTLFVLCFLFVWKHIFCFLRACVLLHDVRMEWVLHWKHILHTGQRQYYQRSNRSLKCFSESACTSGPSSGQPRNGLALLWRLLPSYWWLISFDWLFSTLFSFFFFFPFLNMFFCATAPW